MQNAGLLTILRLVIAQWVILEIQRYLATFNHYLIQNHHQIHVFLHHVVHTVNADLSIIMLYVRAKQITLEHLHHVAQNVWLALNVPRIKHV
jgi:uncharacterized membrane protein